jgi:hypothetical protein
MLCCIKHYYISKINEHTKFQGRTLVIMTPFSDHRSPSELQMIDDLKGNVFGGVGEEGAKTPNARTWFYHKFHFPHQVRYRPNIQ